MSAKSCKAASASLEHETILSQKQIEQMGRWVAEQMRGIVQMGSTSPRHDAVDEQMRGTGQMGSTSPRGRRRSAPPGGRVILYDTRESATRQMPNVLGVKKAQRPGTGMHSSTVHCNKTVGGPASKAQPGEEKSTSRETGKTWARQVTYPTEGRPKRQLKENRSCRITNREEQIIDTSRRSYVESKMDVHHRKASERESATGYERRAGKASPARSAMFEALAHPDNQPRAAAQSPRPRCRTTDVAQQGRSPESWTPSAEAHDRSAMAAVLAHKADPQKYPRPPVREGAFVAWSGNGLPKHVSLLPHPECSNSVALFGSTASSNISRASTLRPSSSRGRSTIAWSSS